MFPRVTVVIPTFNSARYLRETIDSVLAQTFTDLEVVVVDGGSTDDTARIIQEYGERLRFVYEPSPIPNHSRNMGVRAARGEYVAFLDGDDKWLLEKLEKQVALAKSKPHVGLFYAGILLFESDTGAVIGHSDFRWFQRGRVLRELYKWQFVPSPTPLIRRCVFDQVGLFDETNPSADDWEMWLRIASRYEFDYVPEYLALYRVHASVMGNRSAEIYENEIIRFAVDAAKRYPELDSLLAWRLSTLSELMASRYLHEGNLAEARVRLKRAIRYDLTRLKPYVSLGYTFIFAAVLKDADWAEAHAAYVRGKHYLADQKLSDARTSFSKSIRKSAFTWWRPYAGWLLTLGGNRLAAWARDKFGLEVYTGMADSKVERLPLRQY